MKHIIKGQEPKELTQWKALENDDWEPSFATLSGQEKHAVKQSLMQEQGYICCYCERRLTNEDSHIEHFRPQSDPATDALDYSNMLCSCQQQLEKGEPRHCGNLKEDWYDENLLISPLVQSCESSFRYRLDGHIQAATQGDSGAIETIRNLGLNIPKLKALRVGAIEPFLDASLSHNDINKFILGYLEKDSNGDFGEFYSTIRQIFA